MSIEQKKSDDFLLVSKQDLLDMIAKIKAKKEWITTEEVMELMSIKSPTTLQAIRNKGLLDITRISSKLLLYRRSSVLQLLEDNSDKAS